MGLGEIGESTARTLFRKLDLDENGELNKKDLDFAIEKVKKTLYCKKNIKTIISILSFTALFPSKSFYKIFF